MSLSKIYRKEKGQNFKILENWLNALARIEDHFRTQTQLLKMGRGCSKGSKVQF